MTNLVTLHFISGIKKFHAELYLKKQSNPSLTSDLIFCVLEKAFDKCVVSVRMTRVLVTRVDGCRVVIIIT